MSATIQETPAPKRTGFGRAARAAALFTLAMGFFMAPAAFASPESDWCTSNTTCAGFRRHIAAACKGATVCASGKATTAAALLKAAHGAATTTGVDPVKATGFAAGTAFTEEAVAAAPATGVPSGATTVSDPAAAAAKAEKKTEAKAAKAEKKAAKAEKKAAKAPAVVAAAPDAGTTTPVVEKPAVIEVEETANWPARVGWLFAVLAAVTAWFFRNQNRKNQESAGQQIGRRSFQKSDGPGEPPRVFPGFELEGKVEKLETERSELIDQLSDAQEAKAKAERNLLAKAAEVSPLYERAKALEGQLKTAQAAQAKAEAEKALAERDAETALQLAEQLAPPAAPAAVEVKS